MHVPVLLKETLEYLDVANGSNFIDGTVGSGGHTIAILKTNPEAQVLGIDLDQASLDKLREKLVQEGLDQRSVLVAGNYKNLDKFAAENGSSSVDGIVLDLGFSSTQIDDPNRGFSFQTEGPLDMRYSSSSDLTAAKVLNSYSEKDLETIFSEYGEDRFPRRVVGGIARARKLAPLKTTTDLVAALPDNKDVQRRIFQALRIEVNGELENLKTVLPKCVELLSPGGRLVVISFHSLEDRIVKWFFKEQGEQVRILTKRPVTASEAEIKINPRSKPAKLRAIQKI